MQVDVWTASLDRDDDEVALLTSALTSDETDRASRFLFREHRNRFAAARGLLRRILSTYVGTPPERIELRYGSHGKPALGNRSDLCFNLSHCEDVLLVAVARGVEVGVDVERIRANISLEGIAARVMPAAHVAELAALAPEDRLEAFFTRWTCLEARLKARGLPIALVTEVEQSYPGADALSCRHLRPRPGYVGAVAADLDASFSMVCREWTD